MILTLKNIILVPTKYLVNIEWGPEYIKNTNKNVVIPSVNPEDTPEWKPEPIHCKKIL